MGAKRVRRVWIIGVMCAGCLLGLWCGRFRPMPYTFMLLIAAPLFFWSLLRPSRSMIVLALLFGLLLGWWRGSGFLPELQIYQKLRDKPVQLEVTALDDSVYDDRGQLTFDAGSLKLEDGQRLRGSIVVAGRGATMVYRGDRVQLSGKMRPSRGSRQARMSFAQISVTQRSTNPVHAFRRTFSAGLLSAVSEPQASFGLGLLVGQRDTLPEDVSDRLSMVGLTHLIAVSGYNLTIIVLVVRRLTGGRSKYQATLAAVLLIAAFLALTGFSASIVRASVVSGLSLWAWYYGRQINPYLLILFAAALTAMVSPFYIWTDIGWYLSFLAFSGVLILAPLVSARLFTDRTEIPMVPAVAIESFSAQLMTIPIIMLVFDRLSVVSLLANLLVVPVTPLAMLVSLLAGLSGAYLPVLVRFGAWPAELVLGYMMQIVNILSRVPFAEVEVKIPWYGMVAMYSAIVLFAVIMARKNDQKHATITDEKAIKAE